MDPLLPSIKKKKNILSTQNLVKKIMKTFGYPERDTCFHRLSTSDSTVAGEPTIKHSLRRQNIYIQRASHISN